MKKIAFLLCAAAFLGGMQAQPHVTQALEGTETKLVSPDEVAGNFAQDKWHANGEIEYRYEYLTWNIPGTETVVRDVASLEIVLFEPSLGIEGTQQPIKFVHSQEKKIDGKEVEESLKNYLYESNTTFAIAFRYLAKEGSGYLNSDYYIPRTDAGEYVTHTYELDYVDESQHDIYIFGTNTKFMWGYSKDAKLSYANHIYSIETEISGEGAYRLYEVPAGAENHDARKEYSQFENITEKGLYRFEFSFINLYGSFGLSYTNSDSLLNGYLRVTKVNPIAKPETKGENVLLGKPAYTNFELNGNDNDSYTDGITNSGAQVPADTESHVNREKESFFLWDAENEYHINHLNLYWEAATPSIYEVYIGEASLNLDLNAYTFTQPDQMDAKWHKVARIEQVKATRLDEIHLDTPVTGRYILIQTFDAEDVVWRDWGYHLFEIEALSASFNENIFGAQLGYKEENGQVLTAIRFIGKARIENIETFKDQVAFKLTYTSLDDSVTKNSKPIEINEFYKTLKTTLNQVTNESMTAEDGYYFFSLTLKNVLEGKYTLSLLVDSSEIESVNYLYQEGKLSRQ